MKYILKYHIFTKGYQGLNVNWVVAEKKMTQYHKNDIFGKKLEKDKSTPSL